jgi:hypothetical protein
MVRSFRDSWEKCRRTAAPGPCSDHSRKEGAQKDSPQGGRSMEWSPLHRLTVMGGAVTLFFFLQQWEEGGWWRKGKFRNFVGHGGGTLPYGTVLPAGGIIDERLPRFGEQAPPGKDRVCFSYLRQQREQEVCSQEFSLP